ncbi:MAG: hypothetical protein EHM93_05705 [Bacteroidales bacterium]|nr:MAG: hypothetical protein EHM93_05705 [Bacteroidales bacterium]
MLFAISCSKQELPKKNNSYFEPDSTTRVKLLNIDNKSSYDSLILESIRNKDGWLKDIGESDIKKNHVLLFRVTTDASRWENPVLMICGNFANIAIFQETQLLYKSNDNIKARYPITKILKVSREKDLNIYLCFYYNNFFETSVMYFFRIGESDKIADGALLFPPEIKLFSSLNLGFVFETIGLISFFALFFYQGRNRKMLLYFSVFLMTIGFSTLQELIRFFIPIQSFYFNLIVFIATTFIPLSFLGFLNNALVIEHKKLLLAAFIVNVLWCVALPVLSFVLLVNLVYWTGMFLVVVLTLILLIKEKVHRNPEFRYPLWGFIFLIFFLTLSGLYDFGVIPSVINVDYGILVFVISLVVYTIKSIIKSKREVQLVNMELQQNQNRLLILENENIQSQFEALKGQINPHFLFNSLNTLASLINIDKVRATKYVEEFSMLYRRLLDSNSEMLVPLKEELHFLSSYIYLQKIRFGDNLQFIFEIEDNDFDKLVPPLSLQLLIENALKHNEVSEDFPLEISIKSSGDNLVISNPLQPKMITVTRKGIGLENLSKRYLQVSDRDLVFEKTEKEFIIKIPLIDEF